jgi:2',3'-cyclic-nucleotide 2'-phosphodiesterase (5'-nucleotidase family)
MCTAQESARIVLKSATQLELDNRYDTEQNPSMKRQLERFKRQMDQTVNRKIGTVTTRMSVGRPESSLSNFLADQLLNKARKQTAEPVDLCVINMAGIRAAFSKGDLTVDDVYKVLPFEDKLVVLALSGKDLMSLFTFMARSGGEGLSGANLIIKNKKVVQATVNNTPIDLNAHYTIVTFDYLAQGNGGFSVLLQATKKSAIDRTARDCIIEQIEALTAEGKPIQAKLDGRITIETN